MSARSGRAAERRHLLASFAVFGGFWGAWVAVLPDVRERSGLSDGQLGLALGAIAVAAVPTMQLAGRLVDRSGPRRLVPAALGAFAAVTAVLGQARGAGSLLVGLVLLGSVTGVLDVSINTATAAWERLESDTLMPPLTAASPSACSAGPRSPGSPATPGRALPPSSPRWPPSCWPPRCARRRTASSRCARTSRPAGEAASGRCSPGSAS